MSDTGVSLPPSPRASALSQTLRFLRDPLGLSDDAVAECGDLFTLRLLGLGSWVFLCAPDAVSALANAPADVLVAGEPNREAFASLTGVDSCFALDGEAHRARRRILLPLFTERASLAHVDAIRARTEEAVHRWPLGAPFALLPRLHALLLDVMFDTLFGVERGPRHAPMRAAISRLIFDGLTSPLMMLPALQIDLGRYSPWGRVLHLHREALAALTGEIVWRRARQDDGRPDVLSRLLHAAAPDGGALSNESVRDEVLQLLFAGHETSGLSLAWTIERLLAHPDALSLLVSEVETVTGGGPVRAEHVASLTWTRAVIHEGVRMRALAPMAGVRRVKQPFKVREFTLPVGTHVVVGFQGLSRRAALFEQPTEFRPERFVDRHPAPHEWNMFGAGARQCVGRGLALVELVVVLATLVTRTRLALAQSGVRARRRGVLLAPERGLLVSRSERGS